MELEWQLTCRRCGSDFEPAPRFHGCPACDGRGALGVLEVTYRYDAPPPPLSARRGSDGLSRYADLLPGMSDRSAVSLGEGGTHLLPSRSIGPALGLPNLYFKNETANPTWSFKDRYVAVTVNIAKRFGYKRMVVSSTGNLGVSTAAYCAAAGLDCLFLAPLETSHAILDQALLHGAHVVIASWDGRQPLLEHLARRGDWFPMGLFLERSVQNPFGVEGYKTFAYELVQDLGDAPGAVLFPCARGNGLYGAWKGFRECLDWGWSTSVPAMVGCQPIGANSLEESIRRGVADAIELPPIKSVAFSTMETVASSRSLVAIRDSRGAAVSASDVEILKAVRDLGREGLSIEASSALPVACLPKLIERAAIDPTGAIVCVLTAAGIKWPSANAMDGAAPVTIAPEPAALDRYLDSLGLAATADR